MATFKVVVKKKRTDGFYPVYIRVVHHSRMGYIKTDKLVTEKMYPVCVRQIYKCAIIDFNDEERNICRIKFNP